MEDFFKFLVETNIANAAFILGIIAIFIAIIGKFKTIIEPTNGTRVVLALFGLILVGLSVASFALFLPNKNSDPQSMKILNNHEAPTSALEQTNIRTYHFEVFANRGWQDTEITVHNGDQVLIQYISGKWSTTSSTGISFDGTGDKSYTCTNQIAYTSCAEPVPDAPRGSLIAKMGVEKPFIVGIAATFRSTADGNLLLATNDVQTSEGLADNTGSLEVDVSITTTANQ